MLLDNTLQADVSLVCGASGGYLLHRWCRGVHHFICLFCYCICFDCAFVLQKLNHLNGQILICFENMLTFERTQTLSSLSVIYCFWTFEKYHKFTKELYGGFGMTKCDSVQLIVTHIIHWLLFLSSCDAFFSSSVKGLQTCLVALLSISRYAL